MLLVGCGNSEKKEEAPAKTEQQLKEEIKKEIKDEAKKEEEAEKKAEEEKAAASKPKKKAAPAEKTFSARVTVDELPLKGRKVRFEAAAKSALTAIAGKAGYKTLKSIDIPEGKPPCKGGKCFKQVKGTFAK